jgi:hypothetical protein
MDWWWVSEEGRGGGRGVGGVEGRERVAERGRPRGGSAGAVGGGRERRRRARGTSCPLRTHEKTWKLSKKQRTPPPSPPPRPLLLRHMTPAVDCTTLHERSFANLDQVFQLLLQCMGRGGRGIGAEETLQPNEVFRFAMDLHLNSGALPTRSALRRVIRQAEDRYSSWMPELRALEARIPQERQRRTRLPGAQTGTPGVGGALDRAQARALFLNHQVLEFGDELPFDMLALDESLPSPREESSLPFAVADVPSAAQASDLAAGAFFRQLDLFSLAEEPLSPTYTETSSRRPSAA